VTERSGEEVSAWLSPTWLFTPHHWGAGRSLRRLTF